MSEIIKDIKQAQAIAQQTAFEDTALGQAVSLSDKLKEKKTEKKKKQYKNIAKFVGFCLVFYLFYFLFAPFKGGLPYGICKTFIELNVTFPDTILLSEVSTIRNGGVRIWFTHIDSFGSYRLEPFVCMFAKDEKSGSLILAEAKVGKLSVDPKLVERFNFAIPYLVKSPPDLTLPMPIPDSLEDIQFEIDRFRKPLFSRR
ncbi:MAG: hypothetical protein KA099_00165 [Alphaproteobacteria bacterium]|nr:hypothetical protein [Alphaproteobacteria bacterium]MBP7758745.1 hypothetical protein [Alphaproteobacteria bacterium]MBP7761773.1 hypothetical protein [Alphaproteobacteria bacterium]MBP7903716.1 hypothetical protein [Alphaproteobacteria bacterium]